VVRGINIVSLAQEYVKDFSPCDTTLGLYHGECQLLHMPALIPNGGRRQNRARLADKRQNRQVRSAKGMILGFGTSKRPKK
jgi:hypothetical protein